MDIYEKMAAGEPIDMRTERDFHEIAVPEMVRSRTICHRINLLDPYSEEIRPLLDELFEGTLPASTRIFPPVAIDRGHTVRIGENCYINWNFNTVSTGGITIGNDVWIGPNVSLMTLDHDLKDRQIFRCGPIRIADRVWIGEGAKILRGVTVGEGAVVAAGSIVTRDVEPYTLVAGNPAKFVKKIS